MWDHAGNPPPPPGEALKSGTWRGTIISKAKALWIRGDSASKSLSTPKSRELLRLDKPTPKSPLVVPSMIHSQYSDGASTFYYRSRPTRAVLENSINPSTPLLMDHHWHHRSAPEQRERVRLTPPAYSPLSDALPWPPTRVPPPTIRIVNRREDVIEPFTLREPSPLAFIEKPPAYSPYPSFVASPDPNNPTTQPWERREKVSVDSQSYDPAARRHESISAIDEITGRMGQTLSPESIVGTMDAWYTSAPEIQEAVDSQQSYDPAARLRESISAIDEIIGRMELTISPESVVGSTRGIRGFEYTSAPEIQEDVTEPPALRSPSPLGLLW
ncbi:hypothetical protein B0H11DRAFT_2214395 [Mycena galericulata]|nr:hypothetical protein B0H11DRAFT_2214395 [Mycena galericulata]